MFQGLKSQVKSYAKRMIYSYRQAQSLKYFFDKTTQYMAIHKTLKPLPLEHKEAVLDYWSKFINMGGGNTQRLKLTLDWHTIIYNVNQSHPLDVRYLDNPFYYLNILPYFNPQNYASTFADKNYYDTLFPHHHKPKSIIKNIRGNFYQPHNNNPNVLITIDKNSAIYLNLVTTLSAPNETKGSILSVFQQKIKPFISRENLSNLLSKTDTNFKDIIAEKSAIFIVDGLSEVAKRLVEYIRRYNKMDV